MDKQPPSVKAVFDRALEIEAAAERQAYLNEACAQAPHLRQQVEALLQAYENAGSFLEKPVPDLGTTAGSQPDDQGGPGPSNGEAPLSGPVTEGPGSRIGPYQLLQQIGEGGMGSVFMAEQTQPVQRQVALKLIKSGMDSRQVIARFEAERQALALMDHPNIAKVLDAGTTEGGRPYFVMELVNGVPITRYCDELHLTPRQRLELFVPVCQAVQHAHQKGIIHRDLKPSNVLVCLYDDKPVPKVIDFGVAKAAGPKLTEQPLYTEFGQVVGTFEYMSPEQAKLNQLDIDTRSDIYSLGVLLYELLTGTTPLERKRFKEAAVLEVLRLIREEEPPEPSARLSTAAGLPAIAANRGLEPKKLSGLVRGELDWIVMKTLEKDRNRRYETPHGLALDIQRYLQDETVLACPRSAGYRFRKFARRNRVALTTAALLMAALLMTVVSLAVSNLLITQETVFKELALQERDAAQQARSREQEAHTDHLRQGLERLRAANQLMQNGRDHIDFRSWAEADVDFTKATELRPDHSFVWHERAELYTRLGLWDLAAADLAKAFKLHQSDYTWHWMRYAQLCLYVGDTDGYRQLRARMVDCFSGTADPHYALELFRTCALVPDSTTDPPRQVERAERVLADYPDHAWYHYVLALVHYRAGQYGPAVQRARKSLAIEPPWPARAINYPILAMAHHRLGEADEARQALDRAATALDQWNQELFHGPVGSLPISGSWWEWMECQFYDREAKRLIDGSVPPENPRLRVVRARSFVALGRHDVAAAEYAKAVASGQDDPQIQGEVLQSRGRWYVRRGQWQEAAADYAKTVALLPDDPEVAFMQAGTLVLAGHRDEYSPLCRRLLERLGQTTDPRTAYLLARMCTLAAEAIPDPARAVQLAEQAVAAEPQSAWHLHTLGMAHYRAGQFAQAVRRLRQSMEDDPTWPAHSVNWLVLAMAHHGLGHTEEAQQWWDKAVEWHEKASQEMASRAETTLPLHDHDWLAFQLLRREAEALIKGPKERGR